MPERLLTVRESREIIQGAAGLHAATVGAYFLTGIGPDHAQRGAADRCAAHLYASGWLDRQSRGVYGAAFRSRRQLVRESRDLLRQVGLIPGGLLSFFVVWLLQRFLGCLLDRWLQSPRGGGAG